MKVLDSTQFISERMKIRPVTNAELEQIQQDMNTDKYELTDEKTILYDGHTLHRIKALKDIPSKGVKKGDLGGWVESYDNLDQMGDCWVADNAYVYGNAKVYDKAWVYGDAQVYGKAKVYGDAKVSGTAMIYGNAEVYENAQVYGKSQVYDNAKVYGNAKVYRRWYIYGNIKVHGTAKI